MRGTFLVVYYVAVLTLAVFIVIFIWIYTGLDESTPPIDIRADNGLFWTAKPSGNCLVLYANGKQTDYYASWNVVSDPDGSGLITFRNAYDGRWIYYSDNNSIFFTNVRQGYVLDPIGWLYYESIPPSNTTGFPLSSFILRTSTGLYLKVDNDGKVILSNTPSTFSLVGPPLF